LQQIEKPQGAADERAVMLLCMVAPQEFQKTVIGVNRISAIYSTGI
jgi:hypothetical protein